jgi:hypothetical protein
MKIERHPGLHSDSKEMVAPVPNSGATQRSFASALREQRQRLAPAEKDSAQRADARSEKSRAAQPAEHSERARTLTALSNDRVLPSAHRSPTPAAIADKHGGTPTDPAPASRWRHATAGREAPCIEVVHAATGSKFLLSRQSGIWLLAIQSRGSCAADDDFVLALRSLFAQRGLGPLDVMKL